MEHYGSRDNIKTFIPAPQNKITSWKKTTNIVLKKKKDKENVTLCTYEPSCTIDMALHVFALGIICQV